MRACLRACVRASILVTIMKIKCSLSNTIEINRFREMSHRLRNSWKSMGGGGGGGLEREEENSIRWRNGIYQQKHMSHVQHKLAVSANCACYCC